MAEKKTVQLVMQKASEGFKLAYTEVFINKYIRIKIKTAIIILREIAITFYQYRLLSFKKYLKSCLDQ